MIKQGENNATKYMIRNTGPNRWDIFLKTSKEQIIMLYILVESIKCQTFTNSFY